MAQMIVPDPRFRSPTAAPGKSGFVDQTVYSAIVLQHSGSGVQKLFTVPQGQTIPALGGSSTATANAHQKTYTEATTNITKAGELGSGIGDAAARAIGITFEPAAYTASSGAQRSYGATQFEVADCTSKCFFQLRVGNMPEIIGNIFMFPSMGGPSGAISTTGNAATAAIVNNGLPGTIRRLKVPVPIARNDTLEGVWGVAGGATLAFSTTTADGQPTLAWVVLLCNVARDVRG